MKKKGDLKMTQFNICRTPINSKIKKIANFLSRGKLDRTVKQNNYDDVFHLFLIITFENGEQFTIEKNEIVVITKDHNHRGGDCKPVDVSQKNLTFNEVMLAAEKRHGRNFYRYDATTYNCQNFLLNFLHEAGITEFDDFIYQDFEQALSQPLQRAAGVVTDISAVFNRLFKDSIKL